jgi:hypothetical protein
MLTSCGRVHGLLQQRPAAPRPAVSHDACPRWLPTNDLVSVLASGVREAAGHLAGRQTAADTSLATCAGHRLSGRQSFRKQRTVNPLMVPYERIQSLQLALLSSRPASGRPPALLGRPQVGRARLVKCHLTLRFPPSR